MKPRKTLTACALITAAALTLPAIAKPAPGKPIERPAPPITKPVVGPPLKPPAVVTDINAAAKDNNAFALDLFQQLKSTKGNLFFSPYSVWSALDMAYAGAKADTAKGMAAALHLSLAGDSLNASVAALNKVMQDDALKNKYQLSIANQLWGEKTFQEAFLGSFLTLNKTYYGASMQALDFKKDPAGAADTINKWASDKTNERIKSIVSKGDFTGPDPTAMVLTNAIYFKGNWAAQFKKANTETADFFLDAKKTTKADLMYQEASFEYSEDSDAQLVAIPYKGGTLEMLVLLPTKKDGLDALEAKLTTKTLEARLSSMYSQQVELKLPKFKMETSATLNKPLGAMGMKAAFDAGKADFSGIADLNKLATVLGGPTTLYISAVLHKAFVEVNEEGSEAAAVTAVIMNAQATSVEIRIPPKVFTADHAFLFMIRDVKTGAILFMGRVADPKA